ncbi:MAG: hypothetical protein ACW98A_11285 [Candidatus Hodarchaeales archaeon]|jgi:hypothetical protein
MTEAIFKHYSNDLLLMLHLISIDSAFFLLLLHAIHFQWVKVPKVFSALGIGWFIFLLLFGFLTGYSSEYRFFGDVYRLYTLFFLIFVYLLVKPTFLSDQAKKAKNFWVLGWLFLLIHSFNLLNLSFFPYTDLNRILYFSWALIAVYISIFRSEGLLLSESQIIRARKFFDNITEEELSRHYVLLDLTTMKEYTGQINQIKE